MAHVITYDYDFSPYGQKIRLLLDLANIKFDRVDVPPVLPRPELEQIDVKYRRIPVLAIGKDVYADSSLIVRRALEIPGSKLPDDPAGQAYEKWGVWAFNEILPLIPQSFLTDGFKKDREAIFPMLSRSDFAELRPSGMGAFTSILNTIEHEFLGEGEYVGGRSSPSVADAHVAWSVRWALNELELNKESAFNEKAYPKVHAWLARLPKNPPPAISPEDAKKRIEAAQFTGRTDVQANDPKDALAHLVGKKVSVENADTTPGAFPQQGKLLSVGTEEVVLEIGDNGVRLHFPRAGYFVKEA